MTKKLRKFAQVDVFSHTPYLGNPVAVVLDAYGLSSEEMQRLASWTNLSETTFVLPPTNAEADYRLRIFTPGGELPFAGHPTLGSAHAWLENGGKPKRPDTLVQECGAGLVEIQRSINIEGKPQFAFKAPATVKAGPVEAELLDEISDAIGIAKSDFLAHQYVDNGPGWVCVQLDSAERVLHVTPKFAPGSQLMLGLIGAYPFDSAAAFELRAFGPQIGVYEDPVTGSLNASVAQWLFRQGTVQGEYKASQGKAMGREGSIRLSLDSNGEVWVGGPTVTCISGEIEL
jgi:PhzF family phenazine biosynthesis protein